MDVIGAMEILEGLDAHPSRGPTVVTVGKFTVIHRGHRALLGRVRDEAERLDAVPAVVTFDRHPLLTIAPERAPACLLATLPQRLDELGEFGVRCALVLEFTEAVAGLEPETFVERTLVRALNAAKVIVGRDFRFGHKHRGDVELLSELGRRHGFEVEALDLVGAETKISSTEIRRLVLDGAVELAAELIGHPYRLRGTVVPGARRGRTIGFPTANIRPERLACLPAFGVYAAYWRERGRRLPGAANVGLTPTFTDVEAPKIEIHVLDLDEDLYGREGEIEFVRRLRPEHRFDTVDELVAQMHRDVAVTRHLLER